MCKWLQCGGLLIAAMTAGAADKSAPAGNYVGSAACQTCHAEVWDGFTRNPHFRSVASGKEKPENTGCEGCHGPGRGHMENGEAITDFAAMSPAEVSRACLRCHLNATTHANIQDSAHTRNGVGCLSCHSIHASNTPRFLLAAPEAQLCYRCHADVRSQFEMPFKHRVNEGVMTCSDCHNPHGTFASTWGRADTARMVATTMGNEEPCLKCHADKRGPFAYEHPPVRVEGCEMCHWPHGSTNSRLLRRPVAFTMCLECHNGAQPFGLRAAGVPNPPATHNMADPRYRNCTSCHVRIHGSNSSSLFLR